LEASSRFKTKSLFFHLILFLKFKEKTFFFVFFFSGTRAYNTEDEEIDGIGGEVGDPQTLRGMKDAGVRASRRGEVLGRIVEYLAKRSAERVEYPME
jgi:hypothetical protein